MDQYLQQRLLTLNREFYTTVAEPFDATRMASSVGQRELIARVALDAIAAPTLADVGCGNGRLAWLLDEYLDGCKDERDKSLAYVGADANAHLLASAQAHTADLRHVRARFVQADLAQPEWPTLLPTPAGGFDIVTCLATLQHLPGLARRVAVMQQLAALVAPGGTVAISTWQFLTSPRFTAKLVAWETIGVDAAQVDAGDALLPWQQGHYAVRYVHQIDRDEVMELAAAAGLTLEATYTADGKEGNLNLYALLRRPE